MRIGINALTNLSGGSVTLFKNLLRYWGENDKKLTVILNYHSVHPTHKFSTKPDDFLQQMEYLASNFTIISLLDFYGNRDELECMGRNARTQAEKFTWERYRERIGDAIYKIWSSHI